MEGVQVMGHFLSKWKGLNEIDFNQLRNNRVVSGTAVRIDDTFVFAYGDKEVVMLIGKPRYAGKFAYLLKDGLPKNVTECLKRLGMIGAKEAAAIYESYDYVETMRKVREAFYNIDNLLDIGMPLSIMTKLKLEVLKKYKVSGKEYQKWLNN